MRSVVVGVGDELLSGLVVNTNAAMAGELLSDAGAPVTRSVCVGDVEDEIVDVLRESAQMADVVIVTGGLGPTPDDRTREAFSRLLGTPLIRRPELIDQIRERFAFIGREMSLSNERQADIPDGAEPITNPMGTAPGIRAQIGDCVLYAIPGVPTEARRMLEEFVIPDLSLRTGGVSRVKVLQLRSCGVAESVLGEQLNDLAVASNPKLAFLPGGGEVRLRFVARVDSGDADAELSRCEATVRERLGVSVYGPHDMETTIGELLRARGQTVATAESCTAGLVSARLANVDGASDWLRGGAATYSSSIKSDLLGVDPDLIAKHTAVSEPVAVAMAQGARRVFGADFGVSVTCAAGPTPADGVAVGATFMAVDSPSGTEVREVRIGGARGRVRALATTYVLNLLRLKLVKP